jgi:hypothetical protein
MGLLEEEEEEVDNQNSEYQVHSTKQSVSAALIEGLLPEMNE